MWNILNISYNCKDFESKNYELLPWGDIILWTLLTSLKTQENQGYSKFFLWDKFFFLEKCKLGVF